MLGNSVLYTFSFKLAGKDRIIRRQVNEELKGTYRDCRKSKGNKLGY